MVLTIYNLCCRQFSDTSLVQNDIKEDVFVIDISGVDEDKKDVFIVHDDYIATDDAKSSSSSEYFADINEATIRTVDELLL